MSSVIGFLRYCTSIFSVATSFMTLKGVLRIPVCMCTMFVLFGTSSKLTLSHVDRFRLILVIKLIYYCSFAFIDILLF
jgi:hypothetical protein